VSRLLGRLIPVLAWVLRARTMPGPVRRVAAWAISQTGLPLSELSNDQLTEAVRSPDPAVRALFARSGETTVTPRDVLAAVTAPELIGPLALLFDRVAAEPGERSAAVHEAIVLDLASAPLRRHAAMLCVRRHAEEITAPHGRAILARCLTLAEQPVDPYAPQPLAMAARTAAAALIANNPALDSQILPLLGSSPRAREIALVHAAALQGRRRGFAAGVGAALTALTPSEQQALGFARDCDRHYSALDSAAPPPSALERLRRRARRPALRVGRILRGTLAVVAVLALPAAGIGIALLVDPGVVDLPNDVSVDAGGALTALGILVAVHVLSAELSADRLAGPIARATSFPLPLRAGYVAGGLLLLRSLLRPHADELASYSAAVIGDTAALVALVLWALLTLLWRTDSVRAAEAFVSIRAAAVLRAGSALGRLHRHTVSQRELLASLPFVRDVMTEPLGEHRAAIRAPRSGYLLVSSRRLRRIARQAAWQAEQVRLATITPIGGAVGAGVEVMSVVPAEDATLDRRELRRVQRLVRIKPRRGIDRFAEYIGLLLTLASSEAAAGNVGGGQRVRDATLRLLELGLEAVRDARRGRPDQTVGLMPALRTAAVQSLRLLATGDANSIEVTQTFLERLLDLTDAADAFAVTLLVQLQLAEQKPREGSMVNLLWHCGVRVLRNDDTLGLFEIRNVLPKVLADRQVASDLASRLVQLGAVTRPTRAEQLWDWYVEQFDSEATFILGAMRIGATALLAGNASLALTVALRISSFDPNALEAHYGKDEIVEREELRDRFYGTLLGPDAQLALQEFARFTSATKAAIRE
jgi:hypothetical protein